MNATDTECPRCHGKGFASPEATAAPGEAANANLPASSAAPSSGSVPPSAAPGPGAFPTATAPAATAPAVDAGDKPSFIMALVGFLVPLAGLIIYLVQREKQPLTARSAGRGAALGCGIFGLTIPGILLAAILFPVFARARENARRASCQSNMKQLSLAVMQRAVATDGTIPNLSTPAAIRASLQSYSTKNDIYTCPSGHSYQGNPALAGQKLDNIQNPAAVILFSEPAGVHLDGHNQAFADGHVKWFRDE